MDLRALLFSADGSSTATLCQVLTELGIQAEICSEMLVASERISSEPYDAILVDWDHPSDAAFLLRKAREQRVLSLNLALVPDESAITQALQQGANSVIKKPIDPEQAHDTLSTARDLILSRHAEQREKQARLSAIEEEAEPLEQTQTEEPPTPKTGFLQQNMTRTALEAEQLVTKPQLPQPPRPSEPSAWQAARGPDAVRESSQPDPKPIERITQKRWDDVKTIFRDDGEETETTAHEPEPENPRTQDSTGVFSSLPDKVEETPDPSDLGSSSPPQYVVFAVVACVLITGVLYVWAPGDSYLGRMTSAFHAFSLRAKASFEKKAATPAPAAPEKATPVPVEKSEESLAQDPPVESTDVDPSKIQIIETKSIPKAGAQQPPSNDPPPDSDQAKALAHATSTGGGPESLPASSQPQPQESPTPATAEPPVSAPAPTRDPAPQVVVPSPPARTSVIIPDSLRTTPAPSPASNLEAAMVPEAVSQTLLIHRVEPLYPAQALAQHLEGSVVLQAWISKDGSVRDVKLLTGYFLLGRAAFDAVKQWRFKPFTQDGRVVDFQTTIRLNFNYPN